MSLAGIRSNRGDAYQRAVALNWVVQMLTGEKVEGVMVDVIAIPGETYSIYGDDIVVFYPHDRKAFIQAKVNQPNHLCWRLSDSVLKKELIAAYKQLSSTPSCDFLFYSRTPFADLERVIEEVNCYPDYAAFVRQGIKKQQQVLDVLVSLWQCTAEQAFLAIKRIKIGSHHSVEEWEQHSFSLMRLHFSQPQTAIQLLYSYVDKQHSKLAETQYIIDRQSVLTMLKEHGIYPVLNFNEEKIIQSFRAFSAQGRQWVRTIGDTVIQRPVVGDLIQAVEDNTPTVLLEGVAGGGKTCILLDVIDHFDNEDKVASLFVKGDLYAHIESLFHLRDFGLDNDLVAQCAFLAEKRKVVVVIDSLDVLAVGKSHKSLCCFLGLIACLRHVPNVTIIAACRSFDVAYDPMLREMDWHDTVKIQPLSYESDVSPLLVTCGVPPGDVSQSLQSLLIIPQNLRLFYTLIKKGMVLQDIEEHDLYDLYIREVIEGHESFGREVVDKLQDVAASLLAERSYNFSRNSIHLDDQVITRLLSEGILTEVDAYQLMFSHQTLADSLHIRKAQKEGVDLLSFVTSQPQLPFVRPAVRTFVQYLRFAQPRAFTKQLKTFLSDNSVATHLKRLSLETLAEMSPRQSDLVIIKALVGYSPALLKRFLDKADDAIWFDLLRGPLVSFSATSAGENIAGTVLRYFEQFAEGNEEWLVNVWHRAIDEQWLPMSSLVWSISSSLKNLKRWDLDPIAGLLEKLLDAKPEHSDIGGAICKYVDATNSSDELLWKFIVQDAEPIEDIKRGKEIKLNCKRHDLLDDDYLEQRLKTSDVLFGLAMDYLLQFAFDHNELKQYSPFESILLDYTSHHKLHNKSDIYSHDSIHEFMDAVEGALIYRSGNDDLLWRQYESKLRESRELGVRYLLCEAYTKNIDKYIESISLQLLDRKLHRYGYLEYELGLLASRAYPQLSPETQRNHQELIRHLYDDVDSEYEGWIEENIYERLLYVPSIYRLEEHADFYRRCEKKYGSYKPKPKITSGGGWVRSPVSSDQLIELSDNGLVKLFYHYESVGHWDLRQSDSLVGGQESLVSELRNAVSWVPNRFFGLIPLLLSPDVSKVYLFAIIDGAVSHLTCRFGNTRSPNWKRVEPLPDGYKLATTVLGLIEKYCELKEAHCYSLARAIEACAYVLDDELSINRMIFQLWRLGLAQYPEPAKDEEQQSYIGAGINAPRGIAASALMTIAEGFAKRKKPLCGELYLLLSRYASDPSMVVRSIVLWRLPYFLSREPEFGWELVELLMAGASPRLGKHLERTLYYQYHSNFHQVAPYIDQIKYLDDEKTGAAWGRLAALSYLSGYISEEDLWSGVYDRNPSQLEGIGQVFVANLDSQKSLKKCIKGLSLLFKNGVAQAVFSDFELALETKEKLRNVPLELIRVYINYIEFSHLREVDGIFLWLEKHALLMPRDILGVLEKLIERLKELDQAIYFHRPEALITTIKLLLQEADLSDDNEFIDRVLAAQEWFYDQGVNELERLLN
ncbi:hypothetical protein ACJJIW_17185 [Microbulbifer sp. JMSA004]|uniref:hypothetical protein n=1 Tax=Microbulbifer sp. JMSA004 TaxID=3243370 RepID=UPI0040393287